MMYVALLLLGCALLLTVVAHLSSFKRDVVAKRLTRVSSFSKYTTAAGKWRWVKSHGVEVNPHWLVES